ncbi:MAG: S-layer homology domain-containing protein, partial [Oscillospiraceae bacterium]|nr:S-layer homology domain-containing protein [Oscillospiraceae bacterium]
GTFEVTAPEQFLKAYSYTKAPELAQIYYKWMNGDLSNTYINMFIDPSELVGEIENVIKTYGEYELHSENLAGYGLSTLRGGELIKGAGGRNNIDNRYDTWMYYGATTNSHAHRDALQLGLDAYGFNFTPDLGYPEAATVNPNRTQWIKASISHNLILVDNDSQNGIDGAEPLHFDDSGTVKLFDAEAADAYDATDIYRRTAVTVAASEKDAYTVDFFRVKGGKSHVYSFHTQSDAGFTSEDFKFIPQVDENGKYVGTLASPEVERGADPAPGMSESKDYETMYPRGYTWLTDVNRADEIKSGIFSVNFKQTDFNKQVEDSKGLNLKYTAVNEWIPTELAIANGLPPQKSNNAAVTGIDYMLITRESEENMDTLFTSVLQPYKGEEYIASIENADVRIKSGRETADDEVKAIKLNLTNGNTDYVVYATNKNVTYTVSDNGKDIFDFSGFVGVYRENEAKQNIYSYVHDGSLCGSASGTASYSGSVVDFTRTPEHKNEIKVKVNGTADASLLVDKQIIINNEKVENAAYTIKSAVADGNVVTLDIGDITLIDGLVDYTDISKGYTYNIAVGEKFTIPLTYTDDACPEFDEVRDNITTSAGSSVSVDVNAESPLGETITYIGTVLPRGASINADTGIVTWKPDASQIGETGFMITARDSSGRESNISFEITVYGATTGNKNETGETPSTENADTPAGNGGGGGGAAPTDKNDDKTDRSDETGKTDDSTQSNAGNGETNVPQFTDLNNHLWAEKEINALAADGIIKGTTASTFSPANNITRADFALLLVRAFELESDNTGNFADVSANDYFAPELAIARNTGIVNGIGDNKYAPRNTITRQDMMVIVYRALSSLPLEGKVPSAGEADEVLSQYPDFDTVAPYAREAVSALVGAGLVNGKNNLIAPTDYTTRAEVAVLIKRILDYTKQTLEKQNKND